MTTCMLLFLMSNIGRILTKKNMKISFTPYIKLPNMLRPVKDIIPLQLSGVYRIPCICGKLQFGQTGRTVLTRLNEHRSRLLPFTLWIHFMKSSLKILKLFQIHLLPMLVSFGKQLRFSRPRTISITTKALNLAIHGFLY